MHEALNPSPTNRARIILHPDYLAARLAQTEVSAGQHDRVLGHSEANDALALVVIVCTLARILLPIHVCQLKDRLVVQQFLLEEFKPVSPV